MMTKNDNFSKQAQYYAKYRPSYPKEMYLQIMAYVKERACAWDCGTGNGQVAVALSEFFKTIYATDISFGQLQNSYKKNNIHYSQSSAESVVFKENTFDLVTIAQAIHWFDFSRFYQEVNRVLKNNSIIAVIGYGKLQTDESVNQKLSDFFEEMFGLYFTKNRKYVDEQYKTIPFPFDVIGEYEYMSTYNWELQDLQGYLYSWSSVQRFIDDKGKDPTVKLINSISINWENSKEVRFPVFLKLGRIKKPAANN